MVPDQMPGMRAIMNHNMNFAVARNVQVFQWDER